MRITLLLAFCLCTSPAWAAVVCGNETFTGGNPPGANPQTQAYTPDAGSNRVVIVVAGYRDSDADDTSVTGVTSSAGGTFTNYGSIRVEGDAGADYYVTLYYSTNFVDGAQTLSVTYSTTVLQGYIASYTCTGVNTSSPFRSAAVTNSAISATASVDVTGTVAGDLVIDALTAGELSAGINPTLGAGQTSMYNTTIGGDNLDAAGSTEPGGGTITMDWTSLTGSNGWAIIAGALQPSRAAGQPIFLE